MHDHDSGWELGKVEIVSGRGSDKLSMIMFDATSWVDMHFGERLSLHLPLKRYGNIVIIMTLQKGNGSMSLRNQMHVNLIVQDRNSFKTALTIQNRNANHSGWELN